MSTNAHPASAIQDAEIRRQETGHEMTTDNPVMHEEQIPPNKYANLGKKLRCFWEGN